MLKEFATYIAAQTSLTVGTDLEVGKWNTADARNSTLVAEPGGGDPKTWSNARSSQMIQVVNRAKTYFTARTAAYKVYNALKIRGEVTLPVITSGEIYVCEQVLPQAKPQALPDKDANGHFLFSTNYLVHVREG